MMAAGRVATRELTPSSHRKNRQNPENRTIRKTLPMTGSDKARDSIAMDDVLLSTGKVLSNILSHQNCRIVFAESCTAGLVSATLSRISGISEWHCGSAVTYRNDTKHQWLGVSNELLNPPGPGPVSQEVAQAMALGVLNRTPEADLSASITGHLGPNAPIEQDGLIWIAVARRSFTPQSATEVVMVQDVRLDDQTQEDLSIRETRQKIAVLKVLECVIAVLQNKDGGCAPQDGN
ncbi:nicotinamide-nucleotide amidohydrolase family protein [bacterium]|nr:nicotinamide-nucleotide amidohydrolase family protein [bacterium]